jgi:hypothetical protein
MKQAILPVFAIATLIAGPLMAQGAVESGMAGHHGSSAPTMQGGSVGCMEKMSVWPNIWRTEWPLCGPNSR